MNGIITNKQLKMLREEFNKYLQIKNPEWSITTVSTINSDAFYSFNNDVGMNFWESLISESSLLTMRNKIEAYLVKTQAPGEHNERANYYLSALRYFKSFLDENYPSLATEWSGKTVNNAYLKSEFELWMTKQKKEDGNPYKSVTINAYSYSLKSSTKQLNLGDQIESDLFYYTTVDDFDLARKIIKASPDYDEIGRKAGNGAFHRGLDLYKRFLAERGQKIDNNEVGPSEYEKSSHSKNQAYWWVNANPQYWSVSDLLIGEEMPYELYNEQGFKRRIYQNFLDAKPGDPVIFYETSPTKQIVAIGTIGDLEDGERLYFKKTEELQNPIDYDAFRYAPELKDFSFIKNPTGSLFKLNEEEYNYIVGLIYQDHKRVLSRPRIHPLNKIIYGAPGTGKTYSTIEYAVAIVENRAINRDRLSPDERAELMRTYNKYVDAKQIVFTTFHQSYAYEEFVQGIRPVIDNGSIAFELNDGIFKLMADRASEDQENNYVLIIDEINRGNISKIFGELITLIEEDKRWGEKNQLSAMLPSGCEFKVPNNLYIIGTMNSADKSISLIDAALRRRFIFEEMIPEPSLIDDDVLRDTLTKLNEHLKKELRGTDFLIGHSYFMNKTVEDLPDIMNNSIIPLLYEYFYDDEDKIVPAIEACLTDLHQINQTHKGRKQIHLKS